MAFSDITYIDTFIKDGKSSVLGLKNFYDTILISNINDHTIRIPIDDFFLKYRVELSDHVQYHNLSDNLYYKPKSVSLQLYDTTEMWLSLLRLNCMKNITEFCEPMIKIYNPMTIKDIIGVFFKRERKIT